MTDIERHAVMMIGSASSIAEALKLYKSFGRLIPDYKFIFSAPAGAYPGFPSQRKFKHGASIRSLFSNEYVYVLDAETFGEMFRQSGHSTFNIDYSISLDSQALSYLQTYIIGRRSNHDNDIEEVFKFISRQETNVDSMVYEFENIENILDENNSYKIFERLQGFEFIKTIDDKKLFSHGLIESKVTNDEIVLNTDAHFSKMLTRSKNYEYRTKIKEQFNQIYSYMLMASIIQLRGPSRNLKNKMLDLLYFAHNRAGFLAIREIIVAKRFFEEGTKFLFFKKIHKNSPKLWTSLKSMTWDLFHYRYLETAITFEMGGKERYFFPGILSFDKDFIEVMELTPLKAIAFNINEKKPIQFYDDDTYLKITNNIIEIYDFYSGLNTLESRTERAKIRKTASNGLNELVTELEEELVKVSNVMKKSGL